YANTVGASTIVVGAATHRGLPALMDDSATHELSRLARSDIMIVSADAPGRLIAAGGYDTAAQAGCRQRDVTTGRQGEPPRGRAAAACVPRRRRTLACRRPSR